MYRRPCFEEFAYREKSEPLDILAALFPMVELIHLSIIQDVLPVQLAEDEAVFDPE